MTIAIDLELCFDHRGAGLGGGPVMVVRFSRGMGRGSWFDWLRVHTIVRLELAVFIYFVRIDLVSFCRVSIVQSDGNRKSLVAFYQDYEASEFSSRRF